MKTYFRTVNGSWKPDTTLNETKHNYIITFLYFRLENYAQADGILYCKKHYASNVVAKNTQDPAAAMWFKGDNLEITLQILHKTVTYLT